MTVDLLTSLTTFALIFPAELPDKTFIATLVLATRFPRRAVWIGVAAAFAVQTSIAVLAGGLLSLAPERLVLGITFLLFAAGAVIMARGGLKSRSMEQRAEADEVDELERSERINEIPAQPRFWLVVTTSFGVLFAAEWGDLSQILTAGLAARTASPISVFLGSWVALITVAALACLLGGFLRDRFPIWRIKLVSAVILTGLAVWTLIEFINA
jgi:putative Ca2+/H+ antiporter (TMEM165/GDT1 family)